MASTGHVLVLTDLRLGRPGGPFASPGALRSLWADAARVILVGEPKADGAADRAAAMRFARRIRDLSALDGVALTILGGGSDPLLPDAGFAPLARDGRAVAVSAAVLESPESPWTTHAHEMAALFRGALARLRPPRAGPFAPPHDEGVHATARAAASALWHERTLEARVRTWATAHAPRAGIVVTGHPLHPGVRRWGDLTLVNLGSCGWPAAPLALRLDDDRAELRTVLRGAGEMLSLGTAAAGRAAA